MALVAAFSFTDRGAGHHPRDPARILSSLCSEPCFAVEPPRSGPGIALQADAPVWELPRRGGELRRRWKLWWAGPTRMRSEHEPPDGSAMVVVQDGPRWWARDPRGKVSTNRGRDTSRWGNWPGLELTCGRELFGAARLVEHRGEAVIAGRRAALLWALPSGEETRWWHFSGPSEVAIDAERAVVLRAPGLEVTEMVFDEDLAPELFTPLTGRSALGRRRRPSGPVPPPPASPVPRVPPGDAGTPGGLRAEAHRGAPHL